MSPERTVHAWPDGPADFTFRVSGELVTVRIAWPSIRRLAVDAAANKSGRRKSGPVTVRIVK